MGKTSIPAPGAKGRKLAQAGARNPWRVPRPELLARGQQRGGGGEPKAGPGEGELPEAGTDRVEYPLLIGELTRLEFRVNQVPVDGQLKTSAAGRDQLQVADLLLVGGQELARQTEGFGLIVSDRTVLQLHMHGLSPSRATSPPGRERARVGKKALLLW